MADTKWSQFPSATPENDDVVVGLHAGGNARFSVANFVLAIRQGLINLFVPQSRTVNGKALSANITLDATDVGAYQLPSGGIPKTDLAQGVQDSLDDADSAYQMPTGGIPSSDMASAVQTSLGKADTAYQKPSAGIPSSDMTSAVQTSLGKADTAYQKPSGGIPASDLANGVIPSVPSISTSTPNMDGTGAAGSTGEVSDAGHTHPKDTSKANVTEINKVLTDPADQNISIGEYVSYNGNTYVCNTAITTGMAASTFTSYLTAVPGGGLNKLQTDFHRANTKESLHDCDGYSTPLQVYQGLLANPGATGEGDIGNQQSSQLKNFLTNPFYNYTHVTFEFVSAGLIKVIARNASDATNPGKVCYLKGIINNLAIAANWSVTAWEELLPTIAYKEVELGTGVLGTSLSQTARLIGQCTALFGVAATAILSIGVANASLSSASILLTGTYNDGFYIAASQTCTLSSSVKFKIIYTK